MNPNIFDYQQKISRFSILTEDISILTEQSAKGVEDKYLRNTSAIMRRLFIENELTYLWKASGISGQGLINGYFLDSNLLDPTDIAIVAGAIDVDPNLSYAPIKNATPEQMEEAFRKASANGLNPHSMGIETLSEDGTRTFYPPNSSFQVNVWSEKQKSLDENFGNDKNFSINDYLHSMALFYRGEKISRSHVIQYIAYSRLGIHPPNKNKMEVGKIEVLNHLSTVKTEYRDMVLYIYQSIIHDLIESRCIKQLLAVAETMQN